jgi:hypothetical protein
LGDNKILVEKIINDIKTSQDKIEKYIMKGSVKKKLKIDFDQMLPKLEPGSGDFLDLHTLLDFVIGIKRRGGGGEGPIAVFSFSEWINDT